MGSTRLKSGEDAGEGSFSRFRLRVRVFFSIFFVFSRWRPSLSLAMALLCISSSPAFAVKILNDVSATIEAGGGIGRELHLAYNRQARWGNRLFIADNGLSPEEKTELQALLREAGYQEADPSALIDVGAVANLMPYAPFFLWEARRELFSAEALERRAGLLRTVLGAPHTGELGKLLAADPLGLGESIFRRVLGGPDGAVAGSSQPIAVYERSGTDDMESLEGLVAFLRKKASAVRSIGAALFAYENFEAARSDILLLGSAAAAVNLLLMLFFARGFWLPAVLIAGTAVAYVGALGIVTLLFPGVFAVALAFGSTFVSFNNESLVHSCGHGLGTGSGHEGRRLGWWSALGTTCIGFLVMLWADAPLIRQIAVFSLASMLCFILVLVLLRGRLRFLQVRHVRPPAVNLGLGLHCMVLVLAAAGVAGGAAMTAFRTDVTAFNRQTEWLSQQQAYFQARLRLAPAGTVVAVSDGSLDQSLRSRLADIVMERYGLAPLSAADIGAFQMETATALAEFDQALRRQGVAIRLPEYAFQGLPPQSPSSVADHLMPALSAALPYPLLAQVAGDLYRFVAEKDLPPELRSAGIPANSAAFYSQVLSRLSVEIAILLVVAVLGMGLYLVSLHRDLKGAVYMLSPLALGVTAVFAMLAAQGELIRLSHVLALSLVVALAMDYSTIAYSERFSREAMGKILLTGLSSVGTFCLLAFAAHPILRDIGKVVAVGTAVPLAFVLFLRPAWRAEVVRD